MINPTQLETLLADDGDDHMGTGKNDDTEEARHISEDDVNVGDTTVDLTVVSLPSVSVSPNRPITYPQGVVPAVSTSSAAAVVTPKVPTKPSVSDDIPE